MSGLVEKMGLVKFMALADTEPTSLQPDVQRLGLALNVQVRDVSEDLVIIVGQRVEEIQVETNPFFTSLNVEGGGHLVLELLYPVDLLQLSSRVNIFSSIGPVSPDIC